MPVQRCKNRKLTQPIRGLARFDRCGQRGVNPFYLRRILPHDPFGHKVSGSSADSASPCFMPHLPDTAMGIELRMQVHTVPT